MSIRLHGVEDERKATRQETVLRTNKEFYNYFEYLNSPEFIPPKNRDEAQTSKTYQGVLFKSCITNDSPLPHNLTARCLSGLVRFDKPYVVHAYLFIVALSSSNLAGASFHLAHLQEYGYTKNQRDVLHKSISG